MEKNKKKQRKIQQNLLNYVSHNLTNKKDKPKEKERSDSKSSTGRETKTSADKAGESRCYEHNKWTETTETQNRCRYECKWGHYPKYNRFKQ